MFKRFGSIKKNEKYVVGWGNPKFLVVGNCEKNSPTYVSTLWWNFEFLMW